MRKGSFKLIKIIFLLVLFKSNYATNAQEIDKKIEKEGQGIDFINKIPWQELLRRAANANRIVFIDVYTTWCVPCRHMEKEIFPLKAVGDFFNQNFINYRMDAEKGEGISIAKKYQINTYPTYLFIDKKGNLIYQAKGYNPDPEVLIGMGRTALELAKDSFNLQYYSRQYTNNKNNKRFLRKYLMLLHKLNKFNDTLLDQYTSLLSKKELLKSDNATFIINLINTSDSRTYKRIINCQDDFAHAVSWKKTSLIRWYHKPEKMMGITLGNVIMKDFIRSIRYKDTSLFKNLICYSAKIEHPGKKLEENISIGRIKFYAKMKDTGRLIKYAHAYADSLIRIPHQKIDSINKAYFNEKKEQYLTHKMDSVRAVYFINHPNRFKIVFSSHVANILNGIAVHFYELIHDPAELESALKWSNRAVELDNKNPQFADTREKLLSKLHQ